MLPFNSALIRAHTLADSSLTSVIRAVAAAHLLGGRHGWSVLLLERERLRTGSSGGGTISIQARNTFSTSSRSLPTKWTIG